MADLDEFDEAPGRSPDTLDSLMMAILRIIPEATFDEDNDGQVIIYTDLQETDNGAYLAKLSTMVGLLSHHPTVPASIELGPRRPEKTEEVNGE